MHIRVLSDLHLEFESRRRTPLHLEPIGEDLVVLLGDIGTGISGIEWAARRFAYPREKTGFREHLLLHVGPDTQGRVRARIED